MSYIGQGLPADVFSGYVTDTFTGDGSSTTFTLSKAPFSADSLIVVVDNVIQQPTTNFTVSGTTLTIVGTAILSGIKGYAIHTGGVLPTAQATSLASDIAITTSGDVSFDGGSFVFNDSSADKDFRVESNGEDHMLFVDGGNDAVSINSSFSSSYPDSGSDKLQVHAGQLALSNYSAGATGATMNFIKSRGTSAGGAAGTAINQNDVCAAIVAYGDDSNSFEVAGKLQFMAGENWANGDCAGQFELYLTPDGSTTTDLKLRMLNDGRMGVGVYPEASGDARGLPVSGRLHATEDIAGYQCVYATTTAGSGNIYGVHVQHHGQDPDNNTSRFYSGGAAAGNRFIVYSDGDVVNHDNSYGAISDERIKQDIADCNDQWDDIKALKIRNYKKKDDVEKYGDKAWVQLGVIAQELEAAGMDKCVKQESLYDDTDSEVIQGKANAGDIKEYKSVKYSILYMKAIKALQEAIAKIETLETKVKALEDA